MINFDSIFVAVAGDVEDGLGDDTCDLTNNGLLELISRLREAEKDAARYRCIKGLARVIVCEEFDMDLLDGQCLDAMVDDCIETMQCK